MNIGNLLHDVDAPMSILFEDCDVSWRDDYPFESPFYDGSGYMVGAGKTAGSVTVRGGTVTGSAGAGIIVDSKHLSGPTVTFVDVTLNNTGRVDEGFGNDTWMHVSPIMLFDGAGGIGGIWFETVRVIMGGATFPATGVAAVSPQSFLSYFKCDSPAICGTANVTWPHVIGDIRGNIEVEWQGSEQECTPRLLHDGEALVNGSVYGHELMQNVSVSCTKRRANPRG
jgi:hypothetical protein